jgi:hypothetical protein
VNDIAYDERKACDTPFKMYLEVLSLTLEIAASKSYDPGHALLRKVVSHHDVIVDAGNEQ